MRVILACLVAAISPAFAAAPERAERFTHFVGFNLADTPSFQDIARKFGPSPIRRSGDASTSDSRVCYLTADGKGAFEFYRGEVDWGYVFRLSKPTDSSCPKTKDASAHDLNVEGVQLGMTKATYEHVVGAPTKQTVGDVRHHFEYSHRDASGDEWDVTISLTASFSEGRLARFEVDRVETN
jgi:hypothetical protein